MLSVARGHGQVPQGSEEGVLKLVVVGRVLVLAQKPDHPLGHVPGPSELVKGKKESYCGAVISSTVVEHMPLEPQVTALSPFGARLFFSSSCPAFFHR